MRCLQSVGLSKCWQRHLVFFVCSVLGVNDRANTVVAAVALREVDTDAAIDPGLVVSLVVDMDRFALMSAHLVEHDVGLLSEQDGTDIGHVIGQDKN